MKEVLTAGSDVKHPSPAGIRTRVFWFIVGRSKKWSVWLGFGRPWVESRPAGFGVNFYWIQLSVLLSLSEKMETILVLQLSVRLIFLYPQTAREDTEVIGAKEDSAMLKNVSLKISFRADCENHHSQLNAFYLNLCMSLCDSWVNALVAEHSFHMFRKTVQSWSNDVDEFSRLS